MSKVTLESVAAEFRSGNSIPVERATITRERMQEVLEAYAAAKVREELESLQWISVADRLPDERERVLAFGRIRSTNLGPGKIGISVAWRIANRYLTDGASNVFGKILCVTHWMPLPAPPLPGPVEPQSTTAQNQQSAQSA